MVYGELGRYPLIINVKVRMISFLGKLLNFQNSKLSAKLLYVLRNYKNPWCTFVKSILNEYGLSSVWQESSINIPWLKSKVYKILSDQFKQAWYNDMQTSPKGLNYRLFKKSLRSAVKAANRKFMSFMSNENISFIYRIFRV